MKLTYALSGILAAGAAVVAPAAYLHFYPPNVPSPPISPPTAMVEPVPVLPDHHTVSWYRQHPTERAATETVCRDDPGYARHAADCINAGTASTRTSIDAQLDMLRRAGVVVAR